MIYCIVIGVYSPRCLTLEFLIWIKIQIEIYNLFYYFPKEQYIVCDSTSNKHTIPYGKHIPNNFVILNRMNKI